MVDFCRLFYKFATILYFKLTKMFSFFRKKEEDYSKFPEFWQKYALSFTKDNPPISQVRFVAFDTETTGFNYANDRILSIGAVDILDDKINLKNAFEIFIEQDTFNTEAVSIHGIRKDHQYGKITENQAVIEFVQYIGNAILIGHHTGFDVKMINAALERMELPHLMNKYLDTNDLFRKTKIINPLLHNDRHYSLDDLCNELNITMHDRHNAAGDALLTALAFLKLKNKLLGHKNEPLLNHLLKI